MDPAGHSSVAASLIFRSLILILSCLLAHAVTSAPFAQDQVASAQKLADEGRWQELLNFTEQTEQRSPEFDYYRGLALAHLQQLDQAREALLNGRRSAPRDKRFPIELAGLEFKQKHYSQARRYLRAALRLDPGDTYASNFLATIYFLEGNLEAALKYWNRAAKPLVEDVRSDPKLRVNPVLLDHAFAFAPASILQREEFLATEARLNALEIFATYRLDLLARPDEKFDSQFEAQERNGFGNSKLQALLSLFRGLPYQEVNPEYFNIGKSATNFISMLRWDAQKRRASASLTGPFQHNPKWRYRFSLDLRDENWEIRKSFAGPAPPLAGLNLRRTALYAEITRLIGGRLSWSAGVELSHRYYRDVVAGSALSSTLLSQGYQLTQDLRLNYVLWRLPERRFTINGQSSSQMGRLWSSPSQSFAKLQSGLSFRWLPQSRGDDFANKWDIRAGNTFGHTPFDELFTLGMERDNDLWLRAHIGTRGGRKGSAPLGYRYFLANWEADKNVYRNGIITFKLGPFVDTGKIGGSTAALVSDKWLWDTGVQSKLSVLGIGVSVIYGKDLRSGNNAFYTTVGR